MAPATVDHDVVVFILGVEGVAEGLRQLPPCPLPKSQYPKNWVLAGSRVPLLLALKALLRSWLPGACLPPLPLALWPSSCSALRPPHAPCLHTLLQPPDSRCLSLEAVSAAVFPNPRPRSSLRLRSSPLCQCSQRCPRSPAHSQALQLLFSRLTPTLPSTPVHVTITATQTFSQVRLLQLPNFPTSAAHILPAAPSICPA